MDILVYERGIGGLVYKGHTEAYESLTWTDRYLAESDFMLVGGEELMELIDENSYIALPDDYSARKVTRIERSEERGSVKMTLQGKSFEYIYAHRPARREFLAINSMEKEYPEGWEFGDNRDDRAFIDPYVDVLQVVLNRVDGNVPYGKDAFSRLSTGIVRQWDTTQHVPRERTNYYRIEESRSVQSVMFDILKMASVSLHSGISSEVGASAEEAVLSFRPIQVQDVTFTRARGDFNRLRTVYDIEKNVDILIQPHLDGVYYTQRQLATKRMENSVVENYVLPDRYTDHEKRLVDYKGVIFETVENAVSERMEIDIENLTLAKHAKYGPDEDYYVGDVLRVEGLEDQHHWDLFQVVEYSRTYDVTGEKVYPTLKEYVGNYADLINGDTTDYENHELVHPLYRHLSRKQDLNYLV